jgi:hypothetical protein
MNCAVPRPQRWWLEELPETPSRKAMHGNHLPERMINRLAQPRVMIMPMPNISPPNSTRKLPVIPMSGNFQVSKIPKMEMAN